MLIAMVFDGILILAFILLGIVLWHGKGANLIAGYNTAKPQEKAKYNEKALCRSVSVMLFAFAGCFFLFFLSTLLEIMTLHWIGLVLCLLVTVIGIIYLNTSKRVKRK